MHVIVTGYLAKTPEPKLASNKAPFIEATIVEGGGYALVGIPVTVKAFKSMAFEILQSCTAGDVISVVGDVKVRCWENNGEWLPAVDIYANRITTLDKPVSRIRLGSGPIKFA
ncbi:MAG: hypothetical protein WDN46_19115 [Methylocella sp.]